MADTQLAEQLAQFLPRQTAELVAAAALMASQLIQAAQERAALEARLAELEAQARVSTSTAQEAAP